MLFYDQNGAMGQFQGFNNVTHEYRINNIARNEPVHVINFMIGSVSRFLVAPNGTSASARPSPAALLERQQCDCSRRAPPRTCAMTTLHQRVGPLSRAEESPRHAGAPTAVQNGDGLRPLR